MISDELKQHIKSWNLTLGIQTEFIQDSQVLGYSLGNTIYLNESINQDFEKTNHHELLHFYADSLEFKKVKEYLFEQYKDKVYQYRDEYYLRYFGLYSYEEINMGVIDDEIAIDLMIDNFPITISNGLKVGDILFDTLIKSIGMKRYLNIHIKNNIHQMNLSCWEKIFVTNFYDGVSHKMPEYDKYQTIRNDISHELDRLYHLSRDEFIIHPHSPEVIREYESEIKALKLRGEDVSRLEHSKEYALQELADNFGEHLYEEYMHIVNFFKGSNYEDAFKTVLLRETLTKTYKKDEDGDKTNTIVKKRDLHKSISSHMILANDTILKILYENVLDYSNFANLYYAALEVYNQSIIEKSEISIDGVDTYGLGRWIKFEGKVSNEKEYIENSKKLASLVSGTPWCTKTLASSQLAEGDFYVFVDHQDKPHIAVKMRGNEIDEVRGIENGNAQELEDEYRCVALSFLEKNKDIQNGREWLEKEEWNKRLIHYNTLIENGTLSQDMILNLIDDYFKRDYRSHGRGNTNKEKLSNNLSRVIDKLADYYECREEEICLGDYDGNYKEIDGVKTCSYKIIFGNADFGHSNITDLG